MLWWRQFVGICVLLLVFKSIEIPFGNLFSLDISKKAVFLPPIPIGVPYLLRRLKDRLRSNPLHLIRIMPKQGIEFLIFPLLIY